MKKGKLASGIFGVILLLIFIGFVYVKHSTLSNSNSQVKTANVATETKSSNTSESRLKQGNQKKIFNSQKSESLHTNTVQAKESSEEKTNQSHFNTQLVDSGYYIEKKESSGKLTYEKATQENLKSLQAKSNNSHLSIYQKEYNGQVISVVGEPQ